MLCLLSSSLIISEAINRADFPDGFVFGTASSAYQVRSSVCFSVLVLNFYCKTNECVRRYLYCLAGRILDFSNADVAVDQYHRFKVKYGLYADIITIFTS